MKKALIIQPVASLYSKCNILERSFDSIYDKIGIDNSDFDYIFYIDESVCYSSVVSYVYDTSKKYSNVECRTHRGSWALDVNESIDMAINNYEYIVLLHDDIYLHTDSWMEKIDNKTKHIENLGVITFTDNVYKKICSCFIPVRDGYYIDAYNDAWTKNQLFTYHNFPERWSIDNRYPVWTEQMDDIMDYPNSPVKTLSSWSMVMIMRTDILKSGLRFENWCSWTFLNEADFNMECIKSGYDNCWVPDVFYEHHRDMNNPVTRSNFQIIKERNRVHSAFKSKWGFSHTPEKEELQKTLEIVKNTNLDKYINKRYSYDYEYF